MSPDVQEWVALLIVSLVALSAIYRVLQLFLIRPVSNWLLKRGKVKIAMQMRQRAK